MNWISSPLTMYSAMAGVLWLTLCVFLALKRETAALVRRLDNEREDVRLALEQVQHAIRKSRPPAGAPSDTSKAPPPEALSSPAVPIEPVNLSRRSQALRLHRRGDSSGQIAAALRMPRNEVDLLLKVHRSLTARAH